jgi:predicted XRE-type DNA-binding protein
MADQPARYRIEDLLNRGVQPFDDLSPAELEALAADMDPRKPLADPVSLSSDGILIDGHQRLMILLAQGKKWISAKDVRIVAQANKSNALEWAVQLNIKRRHLTVREKAAVAQRLQRERGWSQAKVAEVFGVSRAAVSQWLTGHAEPDLDGPVEVVGRDGKRQSVAHKPPRQEPVKPHPWSERGECISLANKLKGRVTGASAHPQTLSALDETEIDVVLTTLQDLAMAVDVLVEAIREVQSD